LGLSTQARGLLRFGVGSKGAVEVTIGGLYCGGLRSGDGGVVLGHYDSVSYIENQSGIRISFMDPLNKCDQAI
jgi:hypothetical protein